MSNFYIKTLVVTGDYKTPSSIEFDRGLNIICGPSDAGKSYVAECLDFMFGASRVPIDERTGYHCVQMTIETNSGRVHLERELGSEKIKVKSSDPLIISGEYGIKNGKLNANTDLWLKLIGIPEPHQIVANSSYKKHNLTWRYLCHMLLLKEERMIQRPSILLPTQKTSQTATLSALYFLMTKEDFADRNPQEEKRMSEAKKAALTGYINRQLGSFADRKRELKHHKLSQITNLQEQMEGLIGEIQTIEMQISQAIDRDKELLSEIYLINEQLAACQTLLSRYQALKSQYQADVNRLTFLADGEEQKPERPLDSTCPYCGSAIAFSTQHSHAVAINGERQRIQMQLADLAESEEELWQEELSLEAQLSARAAEKQDLDSLLERKLKPQAAKLKQMLNEYRLFVEQEKEYAVIEQLEVQMTRELLAAQMADEESAGKFHIKKHYERSVLKDFNATLMRILSECNYESLISARLNLTSYDLLINEKDKSTFGKGYRAFFNTVLALTLREYLSVYGAYTPGLLILDSPILSLKEAEAEESASDSMKSALFQYMLDHQGYGQMIVIENDIPELAYEGRANLIRFTKNEQEGRYGFLNDVR